MLSTVVGEAEVLDAMLDMALAQLRVLAAESLPPAAALRAEQTATRRAQELVATLMFEKNVEIPPGWSEFVEVDEATDHLLARLAAMPSTASGLGTADIPAQVPSLAPELMDEQPSSAVLTGTQYDYDAAPGEYLDDGIVTSHESATGTSSAEIHGATYDEDPYGEDTYGDSYGEDTYGDSYGDGSYGDGSYQDDAATSASETAAPETTSEPTKAEEDWTLGGAEEDEAAGRFDPYSNMNAATERLSLSEEDEEPALSDDNVEDALPDFADLSDDDFEPLEDDAIEPIEAAVAVALPDSDAAPAATAAIQLHGDGSASVIGAAATMVSEDSMIELGDAADYGEGIDELEEMATGLGLGVVEYEDDEESVEEEESEEAARPPGAPTLVEEEIEALYTQAESAAERDMVDGALLYSDVLDASPSHTKALLARGRLYLDLGDYARAISDFLKAENTEEAPADAQAALGDLFYSRKDYRKAITYFDAAIELESEHAWSLYRRGMSLYYRKSYADAIRDLQHAKKLDSKLPSLETYIQRAKKRMSA